MDSYLKDIFEPEILAVQYENCVRGFLKANVVLFCVYTSTEVAYRQMRHERIGTFEGLFPITHTVLKSQNQPITFDVQLAYITSAVWTIGHNQSPKRTNHAAIRTLGLFEMEDDNDLAAIIQRLQLANTRTRVHFTS